MQTTHVTVMKILFYRIMTFHEKKVIVSYIYQISSTSTYGRQLDSLISFYIWLVLQYLVLVQMYKEIWSHMDMQLEKGEVF